MTVPIKNAYVDDDSQPSETTKLSKKVMPGQIISFALIQGVIVIAAVFTVITLSSDPAATTSGPDSVQELVPNHEATKLLFDARLALGVAIAVVFSFASWAIRKVILGQAESNFIASGPEPEPKIDGDSPVDQATGQLLAKLQVRQIAGQAILEAAAMINAMMIMLFENLLHLGVIACLICGIAMMTPTLPSYIAQINRLKNPSSR